MFDGSEGMLSDAFTRLDLYDDHLDERIDTMMCVKHAAVVCFRLRSLSSLIEYAGAGLLHGPRYRLAQLQRRLAAKGINCVATVAVLPSGENPRFLYPVGDGTTASFLAHRIFLPRRYSLGLAGRIVLRLYAVAMAVKSLRGAATRYIALVMVKADD